jgi:RNA polymerase sigma-70 factor (ECF subfamily)
MSFKTPFRSFFLQESVNFTPPGVILVSVAIDVEAYYEKYAPMVYRRCRSMLRNEDDALDAVQDVFIKLINAGKTLQGQFPSSLLYTIATNTCLNRIRWRRRHQEVQDSADELPLPGIDRGFETAEARVVLEGILETESESTRLICYLYHRDGMTLKEIGETVGMSVSGVKKRLNTFYTRARRKIDGGKGHA